jgi:hypothetical protein
MSLSIPILAFGSQFVILAADRPPNFDVSRTCKLDLTATYGLDVGSQYRSCMRDEQRARQQLQKQWQKFPAVARDTCAPQEAIGGTPSYVSLLTCLQMSNWR